MVIEELVLGVTRAGPIAPPAPLGITERHCKQNRSVEVEDKEKGSQ